MCYTHFFFDNTFKTGQSNSKSNSIGRIFVQEENKIRNVMFKTFMLHEIPLSVALQYYTNLLYRSDMF